MRVHLAIAAAILAVGVGLGVWFARPNGSPDPKTLRDQIAAGPVVVEVQPPANGTSTRYTIEFTILPGTGWIWTQSIAGSNTNGDVYIGGPWRAGQVINSGSSAVARVSGGCYAAIPVPALPAIPGVTIARVLGATPGTQQAGSTQNYAYTIDGPAGASGNRRYQVSEDLEGIQSSHSYTALVTTTVDGAIGGSFTIREASPQEIASARQLIASARPSDATQFTIGIRAMLPGNSGNDYPQEQLAVLRACPSTPVSVVTGPPGGVPSTQFFPFFEPAPFTLQVTRGAVSAKGVVPIDGFDISEEKLARELGAGAVAVPFKNGAVFAQAAGPGLLSPGTFASVFRVESCEATAWFPCGS